MRAALFLAAALLLAGCWQAEPPPKAVSDEPDALQPGLWTISRSVLSQKVGDSAAQVAMTATPAAETRCLATPVTRLAVTELLMDIEGAECAIGPASFAEGQLSASMSCTPPPTHSANVMTVAGSYATDRFEVTVEQKATAIPPGQSSETRTAVDGRRVGEC